MQGGLGGMGGGEGSVVCGCIHSQLFCERATPPQMPTQNPGASLGTVHDRFTNACCSTTTV